MQTGPVTRTRRTPGPAQLSSLGPPDHTVSMPSRISRCGLRVASVGASCSGLSQGYACVHHHTPQSRSRVHTARQTTAPCTRYDATTRPSLLLAILLPEDAEKQQPVDHHRDVVSDSRRNANPQSPQNRSPALAPPTPCPSRCFISTTIQRPRPNDPASSNHRPVASREHINARIHVRHLASSIDLRTELRREISITEEDSRRIVRVVEKFAL